MKNDYMEELSERHVLSVPTRFNLREGYGETWRFHPLVVQNLEVCRNCESNPGVSTVPNPGCRYCNGHGFIDIVELNRFPTLHYLHPLYEDSLYSGVPEDAALRLNGLPLSVLLVGDASYLVVTRYDWGVDWIICEGYIRFGYYPPSFLADLSSRGVLRQTPTDVKIVEACGESLKLAAELFAHTREKYQMVRSSYGEKIIGPLPG